MTLVGQAVDQGIVVTLGNSPLTDLQKEFGPKGFRVRRRRCLCRRRPDRQCDAGAGPEVGRPGDGLRGVFSQAERGQSEKGLADTLFEKAGLKVDRLEITQEANSDMSLAVPVLAAYIQAHPNLEGHRHAARRRDGRDEGHSGEGWQEAWRHRCRRHRPRSVDQSTTGSSRALSARHSISCSTSRASFRSCNA